MLVLALVLLLPGSKNKPDMLAKNDQPVPVDSALAPELAVERADKDAVASATAAQRQMLLAESKATMPAPTETLTTREPAKDKAAVVEEAQRERNLALATPATAVAAPPAGAVAGSAGRGAEPTSFGALGQVPLRAATPATAPAQPSPGLYAESRPAPSLALAQRALSGGSDFAFRDETRAVPSKLEEQVFLRTAARSSGEAAKTSAAENSILTSFKVQPADNGLVIVDGDGSVYKGSLQAANAEYTSAPVTGGARVANRRLTPTIATTDSKRAVSSPATSYFFHVLGTNKTLNQKVEFSGNVWPQTNVAAYATSGLAAALPTLRTNVPPVWLQNSRISGKAIINSRQVIEVNAAPAKP